MSRARAVRRGPKRARSLRRRDAACAAVALLAAGAAAPGVRTVAGPVDVAPMCGPPVSGAAPPHSRRGAGPTPRRSVQAPSPATRGDLACRARIPIPIP
jgi:hypothetical protein